MAKEPIMSVDQEQFMAFEGLVQWTRTVVAQSARVSAASEQMTNDVMLNSVMRRAAMHAFHSECHFFVIAAHKIFEYRDWTVSFGLCGSVDFGEIDQFSRQDIRDLRNMREHIVDYLKEREILRRDGSLRHEMRHQVTERTPVLLSEQ